LCAVIFGQTKGGFESPSQGFQSRHLFPKILNPDREENGGYALCLDASTSCVFMIHRPKQGHLSSEILTNHLKKLKFGINIWYNGVVEVRASIHFTLRRAPNANPTRTIVPRKSSSS
jgi:hypothetical protein